MTLHAQVDETHGPAELDINPFCRVVEQPVPRRQIPPQPMPPERLRLRGWLVPAYTFPANMQDTAVLRVVVRNGFSADMAAFAH